MNQSSGMKCGRHIVNWWISNKKNNIYSTAIKQLKDALCRQNRRIVAFFPKKLTSSYSEKTA